jgi:hypothetical protein
MKRLRDLRLVCLRAVTIRGVNKIHTKFDRATQNSIGMPSIPWSSPSRISA